MKLRESGMPEEAYWESLLRVECILDRLRIDDRIGDAVELGCGYGTFTIPVARRIRGRLHAFDIDPEMIERTRSRAAAAGLRNVRCHLRDVAEHGFGLPDQSADACLLFNILHGEGPVRLLAEAARVVRLGGVVLVCHSRYDPGTPRGPILDIRPRPEQVVNWAEEAGLVPGHHPEIDLPPWHYGWILRHSGGELPTESILRKSPSAG